MKFPCAWVLKVVLVIVAFAAALWAAGAVVIDGPLPGLGNAMLCLVLLVCAGAMVWRLRGRMRIIGLVALWGIVAVIWLMKRPTHERDWMPEFAELAHIARDGDVLTIHNFREFDYADDGTPIERWTTKQVRLSELQGMDFLMTFWGDDIWVGHPFLSFDFGPDGHVAISIEARRAKGERYSLIKGLYKRYEMIYLFGAESDLVRVRTSFRQDERVHLHRFQVRPETVRQRFLEFIESANALEQQPRFYHVLSENCTTSIRRQMDAHARGKWDWRIILNGYLDEMLAERGLIGDFSTLEELRVRSLINPAANTDGGAEGFSERIREGRGSP